MPSRKQQQKLDQKSLQQSLRSLRIISFSAFVLSVMALVFAVLILFVLTPSIFNAINSHQLQSTGSKNLSTGTTVQATTTLQPGSLGSTIAGIDTPLNSSALAVINDAPNAYFEQAGEEYQNGTLSDPVFTGTNKVTGFTLNNKTSVVYLGSITCVFCGENRWAMALALSRFGSFSKLFIGYSALGDSDLPTLYWIPVNYNGSTDAIGNYYSSSIVNFLSIEDTHPITGGFALNNMPQMRSNINATGNETYIRVFSYVLNLSNNKTTVFQGTPYTVWGSYQFSGADAEVFGNSTPTGDSLPLTYETHGQVLSQLANPTDQFAQGEYAAADVYVAAICKSINNVAGVCSLPAIVGMESLAFK
jgi:hypothetical protein